MSFKISIPETRKGSSFIGLALATAGSLLLAPAALAQDHCDTAIAPVTGLNSFDLSNMTTSWYTAPCLKGDAVYHDVWYCFEAPVDGVVNISTCGLTDVDTRIILWPGCGCPNPDLAAPLCCAENECGKQSNLVCEVVCGERYLIQLGSAANGDNGSGDFDLTFEGVDCDPGGGGGSVGTPPSGPCDECGEGDPGWLDQAGFAGGQLMLFTRDATEDGESPILAFDLTNESSAPLGANWAAPSWTHPDWTRANLGTVFGVAIDGGGRGFVAHSSVYNYGIPRDAVGALGGPGAIYQLDAVTGAPSLFATLPQTLDPSIQPVSEAWPGIGNIAWDFDRDVLFATNFDDGRIYRIDAAGTIIDAWDHATDVLTAGGAAEPGDADGFAPLGERLWAVCPTVDRLYYSVWWENQNQWTNLDTNQIWSVRLDASGGIVPGTRQLEIETPAINSGMSNPVSDIAFDDTCCMLVAERSMNGATMSGAHYSRGLRYCHDGNGWSLGTQYQVGYYSAGENCAGGVDFDAGPEARSWFSADAIIFPNPFLYGATGIPLAGDTPDQSVMIDIDQDVTFQEKFQMGSLELTCYRDSTGPCMEVTGELECIVEDGVLSVDYALELEITNNSSAPAHYLLVAGPVSPGVTSLVPELAPGETRIVDLVVDGPVAGETVCLQLTLYDADFGVCCGLGDEELCLVIPECDCAIDESWEIVCIDEAAGIYEMQFDLVNLSPDVVEHVFLVTDPGAPYAFDEDHFDVPATAPFGTMSVGPVTITTSLAPGDIIPFVATLHVQNLAECCDLPMEITLPSCDGESNGHPADLDGDGVVGPADLGIILANWGGSGLGDLDGDGVVGASDLGMLLASFGMTP